MNKPTLNTSPSEIMHGLEMQHLGNTQTEITHTVEATIEDLVSGNSSSTEELMELCLLAGQAKMAKALADFSNVISLENLKNIKKTKSYKNLKGKKSKHGAVFTGTWEDFCEFLGMSRQMVDEQIKNSEIFGIKALESLQSIGMDIRDLRRLRQLPENELKAIVDGDQLTVDSKEEALDIIEEMAAKHRVESNQLNEKIETLTLSSKASDKLLEKKGKDIQQLEKELEIAKGKGSPAQIKQVEAERNKALSQAIINAKYDIFKGLDAFEDAVKAIQESPHPCDLDDEYQSSMHEIISRLMEGSASMGLDQTILTALNGELAMYDGALQ